MRSVLVIKLNALIVSGEEVLVLERKVSKEDVELFSDYEVMEATVEGSGKLN